MNSIVIETERIFLREWFKEDFHYFKPFATNPKVMKYIGTREIWFDDQIQHSLRKTLA